MRGDEADDVIVVPKEQRSFRYLKMRTHDALRYSLDQWLLHENELWRLCELQQFFQLVQKQHLLGGDGGGPIPQHGRNDHKR
eukprot:Skav225534  [mRNA]  locus=scaffold144:599424:605034:+ [translate_table: standard]